MSFPQDTWSVVVRRDAFRRCLPFLVWFVSAACLYATPSNRAALDKHYDRFLAKGLNR